MLEAIATTILSKAGERAVAILDEAVRRENQKQISEGKRSEISFATPTQIVRDAIRSHLERIQSWCSSTGFSDLQQRKSTAQIFVEIDTYLIPLHQQADERERTRVMPLIKALSECPTHAVVLGTAGAGKTTALKKVAIDYFQKDRALQKYSFPLLVELRELSVTPSPNPLLEKLRELLGLSIRFPPHHLEDKPTHLLNKTESDELSTWKYFKERISKQVTIGYLHELGALILLDGYDEISTPSIKSAALKDFEALSKGGHKTRLLLTSRSADFHYADPTIQRFEIAPLTQSQIQTFATRWLGSRDEALAFLSKVNATPFADTTIRPLTIAHLCAIYERIKDIPDKPKSVYRRIVNLLLKEWDEQRLVLRSSAYAEFDTDRKEEFLAHIAFILTTAYGSLRFGSNMLSEIYLLIHDEYGLPARQAAEVIAEIESHNGLIVRGGYDSYEFAHKSLQEFLAAHYIVRLPSVRDVSDKFASLPNELAIATALSSRPNAYLSEVLKTARPNGALDEKWYATFLTRLVLERTELAIGHTTSTTIVALQALCHLPRQNQLIEATAHMIPRGTLEGLKRIYSVIEQHDGSVVLKGQGVVSSGLPSELILPPWLALLLGRPGERQDARN